MYKGRRKVLLLVNWNHDQRTMLSSCPRLTKLDGRVVEVNFSRVHDKIHALSLLPGHELYHVDTLEVAKRTISTFGASTTELDEVCAETAADMSFRHYEYSQLAARIWCSRLHKIVASTFSAATLQMHEAGVPLDSSYVRFVVRNASQLDELIRSERDLTNYDYFAVRTLANSYLLRRPIEATRNEDETQYRRHLSFTGIMESPQFLLMRVAVALALSHLQTSSSSSSPQSDRLNNEAALQIANSTYEALSLKRYTHATPTLFSAGLRRQTLASCYLLTISEDSIQGIFETLSRCAFVSQSSGGVGLNISNVRASGTPIRSTNGRSGGIVPMIRVFNNVARYVDQGGGKRPGAFAIYLEPWHADIERFLLLSDKTGTEELIARDVYTAVWCCDLFMRRVERDEMWSLMCPNLSPGLVDLWGEEFEDLYLNYEKEGRYVRQVPAKLIWNTMVRMQLETGMPFLLHKDHINARSNQRHRGTIRGSNLCTEITLHTSAQEVAVCNLASVSLTPLARDATREMCPLCKIHEQQQLDSELTIYSYNDDCNICSGGFDFRELYHITRLVVRNLDRTIDIMSYPLIEAERANKLHRPLGIGVQGLANVFAKLRVPWNSNKARLLNRRIFETMYRASLHESCELARVHGMPYLSYTGSPAEKSGLMQHDLFAEWAHDFSARDDGNRNGINVSKHVYNDEDGNWLNTLCPEALTWFELREQIQEHGLRNSQRLAPMPTASTAQILGNVESIEPLTANFFSRRVQSGEFVVVNRYLVDDLIRLDMWNDEVRQAIIKARGSVQDIDLPHRLREVYKTVWELPQRLLVDLCAARQPFIDQSQSLNLYFAVPSYKRLTNAHFYAWRNGLKTGMYYLRTRPAVDPIQFTVAPSKIECEACQA